MNLKIIKNTYLRRNDLQTENKKNSTPQHLVFVIYDFVMLYKSSAQITHK